MLLRLGRSLALLLITMIVVWLLVLGWWQSNDHSPGRGESLLYLVVLPLALFGGFMLLRAFIDNLRSPPPPPAKAPEASATATAEPSAEDAAERTLQWAVLGEALECAAGSDAASVMAALAAGASPTPDKQLKDADGFPAFTARVSGLDTDPVSEALASIGPVELWPETLLRSVALADGALGTVLPVLRDLLEANPDAAPQLRLVWRLESDPEAAVVNHLRQWLADTHLAELPADAVHIDIAGADDTGALALIDTLVRPVRRLETPTLVLALASTSALSEAALAHWQHQGRLFTPQHQQGQLPGEAACALLLATPELAEALGADAPVRLSRVNLKVRDKSADAAGRISPALCAGLVTELLELAGLAPADLVALVADCDHRASRQGEALGVLDERFETLDPAADYAPVGTVTGSCAPVGALLGLACATEWVREKQAPVVALSVQHPTLRAAVLLTPAPQPDSPS